MQSREEIKGILLQTLKDFWGYDAFRDVQEDIIFSVIYKQDTLGDVSCHFSFIGFDERSGLLFEIYWCRGRVSKC